MNASLLFMWLLVSGSAMTTGQTHDLPTAQEASTLGPGPPRSDGATDAALRASPPTFTPNVQTEAPPTFSTQPNRSQLIGHSPTGPAEVSGRPSTPATAEISTETSPTPSKDASGASHLTKVTSIPTSPPTATAALASPTTPPTRSTSKASVLPMGPSVTTTTKKTTKPQNAAPGKKATPGAKHGAVVGWVIGGTLVLMMLSFLLIYIRKRKLDEQQITTKNWAGPSPFIENGRDSGQDGPRPSQRVSLSSLLPQRMSRRLSLLPEADEELEDMSPGTTFGDRHREASEAEDASVQTDAPASPSLRDHPPANGVGEPAQG